MNLPNPFHFAGATPSPAETAVASSPSVPTDDATANDFRFVLDEEAFFEAIEPVPLFLRPVIELLSQY